VRLGQVSVYSDMIAPVEDCDISVRDEYGQTVLHVAAVILKKNSLLLQFLTVTLERFTLGQIKRCLVLLDKDMNSFFHLLGLRLLEEDENESVKDEIDLISILFEMLDLFEGDLPNLNKDRKTILHCAAEGGNDLILRVYLSYICDVNAVDSNGWTALHYAVQSQNLNSIKALLKEGAKPLLSDNNGVSSIGLASQMRDNAILALFASEEKCKFDFENFVIFINNPPQIARAIHEFTAESDIELSVKKGEILFVLLECSFKWCMVESSSSQRGYVPMSCVICGSNPNVPGDVVSKRMTLDYLLENPESLYHVVEQNRKFSCLFCFWFIFSLVSNSINIFIKKLQRLLHH
jgi:hypothetical protein